MKAVVGMRLMGVVAVLAGLSTPGCKTRPEVGMRMILPPGAQRMDVPKDKILLMASPFSQPMPEFPAGVSRGTEVSACVEIVVDEWGAIGSTTPIYALPECPLRQTEMDPRIVASVIEAVKRWQFLAAAICTFPPGAPKTDDCSGNGVMMTPVAIKLSYVFSFQSSGRVTAQAKRV